MAKKKKKAVRSKATQPKSFSGVIRGCPRPIQTIAKAIRDLVYEELPNVEERFYGAKRPFAMYRTSADVCWIQPHSKHCNIYLMRGTELTDPDGFLEGSSDRFKHAKVRELEDLDRMPMREWLHESVALNDASVDGGMDFDEVLNRLREICLVLPKTKETLTWGIPHFRVGEKIFCGCSDDQGQPRIGLKMEPYQSEIMMKLDGVEKAPYSRKGDGWVTIHPNIFDDWTEIESLLLGSYRLIAPKRTIALLDEKQSDSKPPKRRVKRRKR